MLAKQCATLKTLHLQCCHIEDVAVIAVAQNCSTLTHLNLWSCRQVTDAAVIAVAQNCPALTCLNLGFCHALTDAAVNAVAQNCPALIELNLAAANKTITGAAIIALCQSSHNLMTVNLGYVQHFSAETKAILAQTPLRIDYNYSEW
jgi:hypothetical protein